MGKEAAGAAGMGANPYVAAGSMVAGGVMNLIEANKQADAKRAADRAAEKAIQEAQRQMEQNFLGAVQVPMGAYNNAVLQNVAQQQQSIGALQEAGPRELAGGIGRVNEVANQGTAQLTENIADRLYGLNVAQAQEQALNADQIAALKQAQAQGAQMASMAAQKAKIASQFGALNAFGNAATGLSRSLTPVYQTDSVESQLKQAVAGGINTKQPTVFDYSFLNQNNAQTANPNITPMDALKFGLFTGTDVYGNPIYKQ
jgi:hypothetical protein